MMGLLLRAGSGGGAVPARVLHLLLVLARLAMLLVLEVAATHLKPRTGRRDCRRLIDMQSNTYKLCHVINYMRSMCIYIYIYIYSL